MIPGSRAPTGNGAELHFVSGTTQGPPAYYFSKPNYSWAEIRAQFLIGRTTVVTKPSVAQFFGKRGAILQFGRNPLSIGLRERAWGWPRSVGNPPPQTVGGRPRRELLSGLGRPPRRPFRATRPLKKVLQKALLDHETARPGGIRDPGITSPGG